MIEHSFFCIRIWHIVLIINLLILSHTDTGRYRFYDDLKTRKNGRISAVLASKNYSTTLKDDCSCLHGGTCEIRSGGRCE